MPVKYCAWVAPMIRFEFLYHWYPVALFATTLNDSVPPAHVCVLTGCVTIVTDWIYS